MYTLPRYRRVVFGIVCILLAIAVTYIMLPFWQALAWGAVLAMLVYPLFSRIKPRLGATWATIITTTATLFFIVTPLFLVGLLFAGEVNQIVRELQKERPGGGKALDFSQLIKDANDWLKPTAEGLGMQDFDLQQTLNKAVENSQFNALDIGKRIIAGILTFTFALILLFFLLRDGHLLEKPAIDLIPLPEDQTRATLKSVYDMVHATFYGIVLVALAQGTVAGITYWILGVPGALLLGAATVILCTIPFAGAPILWVPIAILLASQGEWGKAVALCLIGAFVVGLIDNIFRPKIIATRVKVHPIAVFFALIGGVVTLGPVGIVLGPVLLILSIGAIQILRQIAARNFEEETHAPSH